MPFHVRYVDGDLLCFVHAGTGRLETEFGPLDYRQGDWVYLPKQGSCGMTVQVPAGKPWGLPYEKMGLRNSDIDGRGKIKPGAPPAQLYNLREDLPQTTNRLGDEPDAAKRLAARMEELVPKPKRPGKK